MTDQECKKLVCMIFEEIDKAVDVKDIENIPVRLPKEFEEWAKKIDGKKPGNKFPRLRFRLVQTDIDKLKGQGILSDDLQFNNILAKGELSDKKPLSPLEKLLYAILWKNGHLGKEMHVIEGINGIRTKEGTGIVFNKFGAYLSGSVPYILDQHTLRSYAVYKAGDDCVLQARKIETLTTQKTKKNKGHNDLIQGYVDFYGSLGQRLKSQNCPNIENFYYELDRLLFGLGKLIKAKKKATDPDPK